MAHSHLRPRACQPTAVSRPLVRRQEVNDHPASLGVTSDQNVGSQSLLALKPRITVPGLLSFTKI